MSFTSNNFDCPCCGAEVSAGANFCRACGASDDSGWNLEEEEGFASDDDFDYEEFLDREFSITRPSSLREQAKRILTAAIIILICISITLLSLFGL
ncbi:MAG: zinc ribbon domain-containing protein [Planctomycetia bacterium]|nr:zinc ribbon domain-containing protein [Planctomycetia bacterium]